MENYFIPEGFKDYLPIETEKLRELENNLLDLFKRKGFLEIRTPSIEYFSTLSRKAGQIVNEEIFSFVRKGKFMALRAEMTTPIARMVAQKMQAVSLPIRLSYSGRVFRQETPFSGRNREYTQSGVELIGLNKPSTDAELISLFIESLKISGFKDFKVALGQVEVLSGSLDKFDLKDNLKQQILYFAARKNLVEFKNKMKEAGIKLDDCLRLFDLYSLSGEGNFFEKANSLIDNTSSIEALEKLQNAYQILSNQGYADYLILDLGLIRDFSYYTGIVFEGYLPQLGKAVGGGGRYDQLLAEFGYPQPAAGFALSIEMLNLAKRIELEQQ